VTVGLRAATFGSGASRLVKPDRFRGAQFAQRFASELDTVCGMDQAVEHRVCDGWVPDVLVPVGDRQLAGDHGGGAAVAVVDDLEQVASVVSGEWCNAGARNC
jgi:hypothetical protein